MLQRLGSISFGQWMLLITLSSLGSLASMGVAPAITLNIAESFAKSSAKKIEIINSGIIIIGIGFVGLVCIYISFWSFIPIQWYERLGNNEEISLILQFSLLITIFEQIDSIYAAALKGLEKYKINAIIELFTRIFLITSFIIIADNNFNLFLIFLSTAIFSFIKLITRFYILNYIFYNSSLFNFKISIINIKKLINFGKWSWFHSVGAALFASVDRLIVGSAIGSSALGQYAIYVQITQQIHAIPSAGASVIFPAIGRIKKSGSSIHSLAIYSFITVFLISTIIGIVLYKFGDDILNIWFKNTKVDYITYNTLILSFILLSISIVMHYIVMGLNKPHQLAIGSVIAGLVSCFFCCFEIDTFGMAAGAVGKVIYALVTLLVMLYFIFKGYKYGLFKSST